MNTNLGRWTHAVLRIAAGLLFLQHGLQKLVGTFGGVNGTTVALASQMGVAGILELVGGCLLIVGFMTRPTAIVLAGEMIAAYFIAHMPQGGWPIQNLGELALLYCAIFVFLAGNGAGPLSVDSWIPAVSHRDRRTIADRRRRMTIESPA
jgi:putative oxidoreductase